MQLQKIAEQEQAKRNISNPTSSKPSPVAESLVAPAEDIVKTPGENPINEILDVLKDDQNQQLHDRDSLEDKFLNVKISSQKDSPKNNISTNPLPSIEENLTSANVNVENLTNLGSLADPRILKPDGKQSAEDSEKTEKTAASSSFTDNLKLPENGTVSNGEERKVSTVTDLTKTERSVEDTALAAATLANMNKPTSPGAAVEGLHQEAVSVTSPLSCSKDGLVSDMDEAVMNANKSGVMSDNSIPSATNTSVNDIAPAEETLSSNAEPKPAEEEADDVSEKVANEKKESAKVSESGIFGFLSSMFAAAPEKADDFNGKDSKSPVEVRIVEKKGLEKSPTSSSPKNNDAKEPEEPIVQEQITETPALTPKKEAPLKAAGTASEENSSEEVAVEKVVTGEKDNETSECVEEVGATSSKALLPKIPDAGREKLENEEDETTKDHVSKAVDFGNEVVDKVEEASEENKKAVSTTQTPDLTPIVPEPEAPSQDQSAIGLLDASAFDGKLTESEKTGEESEIPGQSVLMMVGFGQGPGQIPGNFGNGHLGNPSNSPFPGSNPATNPNTPGLQIGAGRGPNNNNPTSSKTGVMAAGKAYYGVLKAYQSGKGFGFIACEELQTNGKNTKDVYLSQSVMTDFLKKNNAAQDPTMVSNIISNALTLCPARTAENTSSLDALVGAVVKFTIVQSMDAQPKAASIDLIDKTTCFFSKPIRGSLVDFQNVLGPRYSTLRAKFPDGVINIAVPIEPEITKFDGNEFA